MTESELRSYDAMRSSENQADGVASGYDSVAYGLAKTISRWFEGELISFLIHENYSVVRGNIELNLCI